MADYVDLAIGITILVVLSAYVIIPALGFFFNATVGTALVNAPSYVVPLLDVAIGIGVAVTLLVVFLKMTKHG